MKRIWFIIVVAVFTLSSLFLLSVSRVAFAAAGGCGFKISPTGVTVIAGGTATVTESFSCSPVPKGDMATDDVTNSAADPSIFYVDPGSCSIVMGNNCTVTIYGESVGTSIMTANSNIATDWQGSYTKTDTISVTVTPAPTSDILPAMISIDSATVSAGLLAVSGKAMGPLITQGQECPQPSVVVEDEEALPLMNPTYAIDGGSSTAFSFTQVQKGIDQPCGSATTPARPYEYSFSFNVDVSSLAPGTHMITVCATDGEDPAVCASKTFSISGGTIIVNSVNTNGQPVAASWTLFGPVNPCSGYGGSCSNVSQATYTNVPSGGYALDPSGIPSGYSDYTISPCGATDTSCGWQVTNGGTLTFTIVWSAKPILAASWGSCGSNVQSLQETWPANSQQSLSFCVWNAGPTSSILTGVRCTQGTAPTGSSLSIICNFGSLSGTGGD